MRKLDTRTYFAKLTHILIPLKKAWGCCYNGLFLLSPSPPKQCWLSWIKTWKHNVNTAPRGKGRCLNLTSYCVSGPRVLTRVVLKNLSLYDKDDNLVIVRQLCCSSLKVTLNFVVPENIHTSPTEGICRMTLPLPSRISKIFAHPLEIWLSYGNEKISSFVHKDAKFWEFHEFSGTEKHLKKYKERDQDLVSWRDSRSIEVRSTKFACLSLVKLHVVAI